MPILRAEALAQPRLEARAPSAREQSRSLFQTRPKSLALNPDLPASSIQCSLPQPPGPELVTPSWVPVADGVVGGGGGSPPGEG